MTVGVPGGIPDRQAIGATVDAAEYGTGLVDAAGAIGAAIDACPPGKVVFIPAGTYRMDSRVYRARASHITVRGAGMGKTVLKANLSYNGNVGTSTMAGMDISVSHGPHNMLNLVEGNIAGGMGSDGYFGSTSHITIARNWFTATHPTAKENLIALNVGRWNNYFNVVGNILGTSEFSSKGLLQPETPFGYATPVIYKIGFPNMGNNGFSKTWGPTTPPDYTRQSANQPRDQSFQELDLNVKSTMIRQGNYDYLSRAVAWDPAIADRAVPDSYFRASKPDYFGDLAWPPFDPASPPGAFNDANLCKIPAGYRYVHGTDPPGAGSPSRAGKSGRSAAADPSRR